MLNGKFKKYLGYIESDVGYLIRNKRSNYDFDYDLPFYAKTLEKTISYVYEKVNKKQLIIFEEFLDKQVYCKIGSLALLSDKLFDRVNNFYNLNDENSYDKYKDFVFNILDDLSYRVFNYPILDKCITCLLNKYDFSFENLLDVKFVSDYLMMKEGKVYKIKDFDNEYKEEKATKLVEIIDAYLNQQKIHEQEELEKEKQRIQDEIKAYKNKRYDCKATINIEKKGKKYPICNIKEFSYIIRGFRTMNQYKTDGELASAVHGYSNEGLINEIVLKANPFAVLEYIFRVIDGTPFNPNLMDNINYVLNKVKLISRYNISGRVGESNYLTVVSKYLMAYFGINQEANPEKAEQYLMVSCEALNDANVTLYLCRIVPQKYLNLILGYADNIEFYEKYKKAILACELDYLPYKTATLYLKYKKENLDDEEFCKLIDTVSKHEELHRALCDDYKEVYEPYKIEKLRKEEQARKKFEEEFQRRIQEEAERKEKIKAQLEKMKKSQENVQIVASKTYSKEEIEELKTKTDDAKAMNVVAKYYFDLETSDRMHYVSAYKYYLLAAKAGNYSGYVNAAISYVNLSNQFTGQEKTDALNTALDILLKYAETNEYCAYYYFVFFHKTKKAIDKEFAKKILDISINKRKEDDNTITLMRAAYQLYISNYLESIEEFKKIQYKINDQFFIESYVSNLYEHYIDDYNSKMGSKGYDLKDPEQIAKYLATPVYIDVDKYNKIAKEIISLVDWASIFNIRKIKIDIANYCLVGNKLFPKDRRKAYEILKSMNGNYGDSREYYQKKFEELKAEFEGNSKKK